MIRRNSVLAVLSLAVAALVLNTTGVAQKGKPPKETIDYKGRQVRPIKLGTSGGNAGDLANGYCCSGTLGSLVQKGGAYYILSNTHVFAGDSTPGGNGSVSEAGDAVNQPGLIDVACQTIGTDYVANLSDWAPLGSDANVDAAIAQIQAGAVDTTGAILGIGTISSTPAPAAINQKVKKSGRTTGTTSSTVSGLNATINVGYSDECAGDSFTAQFTGQILVSNRGSRFLAGGDSGSLMVENVSTNPRPVGLLYAGSSSIAVANPIQDVLDHFGVTMVGAASGASSAAGAGGGTGSAAAAQGLERALQVQQARGDEFLRVPGAVGHAVGAANGRAAIQVLVETITPAARAAIRDEVDGVPVVLEEVGQVRAFPACTRVK